MNKYTQRADEYYFTQMLRFTHYPKSCLIWDPKNSFSDYVWNTKEA